MANYEKDDSVQFVGICFIQVLNNSAQTRLLEKSIYSDEFSSSFPTPLDFFLNLIVHICLCKIETIISIKEIL